jgi:hypothetical protein
VGRALSFSPKPAAVTATAPLSRKRRSRPTVSAPHAWRAAQSRLTAATNPDGPFAPGPRRGPAGAGPRVGSQAPRHSAAPPACHRRPDHPVPRHPPAAAARTTCDRLPPPGFPNTRGAGPNAALHVLRLTAQSSVHHLADASRIEQPDIGRIVSLFRSTRIKAHEAPYPGRPRCRFHGRAGFVALDQLRTSMWSAL